MREQKREIEKERKRGREKISKTRNKKGHTVTGDRGSNKVIWT